MPQRANIGDEVTVIQGSASPGAVADMAGGTEITVRVPWNAAFRARTLDIGGRPYGHIHIRTFYVEDADGFVQEFIRLAGQMPENGLILDVRGNGGGNIWAVGAPAADHVTASRSSPSACNSSSTPGTLDLCRNNPAASPDSACTSGARRWKARSRPARSTRMPFR